MARKVSTYQERVVEVKFAPAEPCWFCGGKIKLGDRIRFKPGHWQAHEHCGRGESLPKIGASK